MVVENNYFATPAWPVGPGGRRDYLNFMKPAEYNKLNFCTRFYWGCGSRQYWAHNTSKDIGPGHGDYNKGESILFHSGCSGLFAQVAGRTSTATAGRAWPRGTCPGAPLEAAISAGR